MHLTPFRRKDISEMSPVLGVLEVLVVPGVLIVLGVLIDIFTFSTFDTSE